MTPFQLSLLADLHGREQICDALEITKSDLSATINGLRPNHRIRQKLAEYFKKSVDELFGADFEAVVNVQKV